MAHTYTYNEIQAIINESFRQGWEARNSVEAGSSMPKPPPVHLVVDHPYTGSNAPGQPKRPWLEDNRGKRGTTGGGT